ncbi:hypothetical protein LY622_05815 [Halomonas sp. M5N1S17]|uniref:DUF6957 family protein n=1 Tax=Halomonas alkalisoli TaxID=2907158 RepID=UPI001F16C58F|nr:hypothetical protein [Halomonas alkalisoli]MCE9662952.1 hypothetical protein [Halomonas alkalisoli]
MLDNIERDKQAAHLTEQYRGKLAPSDLKTLVDRLLTCDIIKPQPHWAIQESDIRERASIVREWQIVNVIDTDEKMSFLFSDMLVWDYKHRGSHGDYIFTSLIANFDIERGLVQTRNTLYCLDGDGEEVNATLLEANKMKMLGQSLHMIRAVEQNIGPIIGSAE